MKKSIVIISLIIFCGGSITHAQQSSEKQNEIVLYTFFFNVVPDNFNVPLVGFFNVARGNHTGLQVGFVNTTFGQFTGGQIGFVNSNIKSTTGIQIGYINTSLKEFKGSQIGFVNTNLKKFVGAQIGFVNINLKTIVGPQIGFVNTTLKDFQGSQIGFVNTAIDHSRGPQIGFVNTAAKNLEGAQIGFVNTTAGKLKGAQLGFVNYADSIEKGIPFGFLSIVRKGGFQAFELSSNPAYPLNLSFEIGVSKLYTSFIFSCNPGTKTSYGSGMGVGTHIDLSDKLLLNIEASSISKIGRNYYSTNQIELGVGYRLSEKISILASVNGAHQVKSRYTESFDKPLYSLLEHEINDNNRMLMGFNAGIKISL
ncbi:MAG: hypothetical protein HN921_01905 [Bacteroidetes bacterium]|nr:hypothetical protein [Bacteroidota bacterium]